MQLRASMCFLNILCFFCLQYLARDDYCTLTRKGSLQASFKEGQPCRKQVGTQLWTQAGAWWRMAWSLWNSLVTLYTRRSVRCSSFLFCAASFFFGVSPFVAAASAVVVRCCALQRLLAPFVPSIVARALRLRLAARLWACYRRCSAACRHAWLPCALRAFARLRSGVLPRKLLWLLRGKACSWDACHWTFPLVSVPVPGLPRMASRSGIRSHV